MATDDAIVVYDAETTQMASLIVSAHRKQLHNDVARYPLMCISHFPFMLTSTFSLHAQNAHLYIPPQVQRIPFAHDDAYIAASGRLPCAIDASVGTIFLATSSEVICLQPVEAEKQVGRKGDVITRFVSISDFHHLSRKTLISDIHRSRPLSRPKRRSTHITITHKSNDQVWELLRQRQYPQAIEIALSALPSAPWAGPALAQAGLLLLHDMRAAEAVEALAACPLEAWQPAQLLPLFPEVAVRWLPEAPPAQPYWGLHGPGPLQSERIERMISARHELRAKELMACLIIDPSVDPQAYVCLNLAHRSPSAQEQLP